MVVVDVLILCSQGREGVVVLLKECEMRGSGNENSTLTSTTLRPTNACLFPIQRNLHTYRRESTDVDSTAAPELCAPGLRNPWRCSFDRLNDDLWCGDVGQEAVEEVNIIE